MELAKFHYPPDLGKGPKGLSSEFHQNRSHTGTTCMEKTTNATDPLVRRTGHITSIAATLASLASLR